MRRSLRCTREHLGPLASWGLAAVVSTSAWPAWAAIDEPGFGGASAPETATPDDEEVCVVQGKDGAWHPCSDFLPAASSSDEPQAQALREQMRTAEAASQGRSASVAKTKLELELEKAHLDPTLPLLALRIDVARAEAVLASYESRGQGGAERDQAEKSLAAARAVLDDVEKIAIRRMDTCAQRRGSKPLFKNWRMTAGGAVALTHAELMAQLPVVDPAGCERIVLIDENVVARVRRAHELRRILATTTFGYFQVDARRALEAELRTLDDALKKEIIPTLYAPGVPDPY